jgi:hypothetical protein
MRPGIDAPFIDLGLRAIQANLGTTGFLGLRLKHCYSTKIDPLKQNLIVVNTDVEHIYIFNYLTANAITHDLNGALDKELRVATLFSGTDAPIIDIGLRAVQANLRPTSTG